MKFITKLYVESIVFFQKGRDDYRIYRSLSRIFLDIFDNTGIWSEELIRSGYIQASNNLQTDIRETILRGLSGDVVGYTPIDSEIKSTILHTKKRNIAIEYSEDSIKRIRYVGFIRIHRQK